MRIFLANGQELRGDLIPLVIVRTDLVAVPSNLELLVRVDETSNGLIQTGKTLSVQINDEADIEVNSAKIAYNIISVSTDNNHTSFNQGNPNYVLKKVIALLDSCHKVAFALEKAVIKENASMSAIYRACGANIAVKEDIKINKFTALIGDPPSFSIMQALQREAAVTVWDNKQDSIAFKRIQDLFSQKPKEKMPLDMTQNINSGFKERHQAPAYFSNNENGDISASKAKKGRGADFALFADERTLNNLSQYLTYKKIWTTKWAPFLNAGDIVEIEENPFVVATAVHLFSQAGSGSGSQLSRFWLAELSTVLDKSK